MIAIALITVRAEHPPQMQPTLRADAASNDPLGLELARCATITISDAACEAAWSAHRHRFWGDDNKGDRPGNSGLVLTPDPNTTALGNQAADISAIHEPVP